MLSDFCLVFDARPVKSGQREEGASLPPYEPQRKGWGQ